MAPRHFLLIILEGGTVCGEYKTCNARDFFKELCMGSLSSVCAFK